MKLLRVYRCFCDETRLRILNLLTVTPLCVCHLQEVLGKDQVQVSKHLAYLRKNGMAQAKRHQAWMIYSLPSEMPPGLKSNLACLQDCQGTEPIFRKDRRKLKAVLERDQVGTLLGGAGCCGQAGQSPEENPVESMKMTKS